jgi:FKBP-type peptidyl-prolyl cis-trans isomerase FkpA
MIDTNTGRALSAAAALTLALAACGGTGFGPEPTEVEFEASLGIDLDAMTETPSGLFIWHDSVGTGEAAVLGDQVTLTYTGWLVDGEQFDSGDGYVVELGVTNLIAGFTEGVVGMRVGGTRTIVVPADLGYGSQESSGIPRDAVLVFELMVTELRPMT